MKLPIALATLFLAATTAVPAFAAMPAPHATAQYQQGYRDGYNANRLQRPCRSASRQQPGYLRLGTLRQRSHLG